MDVVESRIVTLSKPFKLESESSDDEDYRAPNLLQRVLSLVKNMRPTTDLTRFQVPPTFNLPKSQLQCYGETVYCIKKDLLGECANGKSSLDRFISVVSWTLSTVRPLTFGVIPYNPILGETHHVSRGSLNVLVEQVSHHPPVCALHATDEKNDIDMIWSHRILPKFKGTSIEILIKGERKLKLQNKGENYIITYPNMVIKFMPLPGSHWSGNVHISCEKNGLAADLNFGATSFFGGEANNRSIRGKIYLIPSLKTTYEIDGHWDRIVTIKDVESGKIKIIHNAEEVISGLKTPILKDPQGTDQSAKSKETMVMESRVVTLSKPFKLESETSDDEDYGAPNLLRRVLSLVKNIRPSTDLTRFQVPPTFNLPKSQLQCYGETVYCINKDLLSECANGKSSLERFISVVSWTLSTIRPLIFGVAPYNPILGETHHVSRGSLNVLLEQISHHPPVSALHATDEKNGIEMIWCLRALPKFNGTSVEILAQGERKLKLHNKGESYIITHPNMVIKFMPLPGSYWSGNIKISCEESELVADICFGGKSFLGRTSNNRSIRGKIYAAPSSKTIYEIGGRWDRIVTIKDVDSGKITIIHNAEEVIARLETPILEDPQGVWPSESAIVWGEVSQQIMRKGWEKAKEAKTVVEDKQRDLSMERKVKGETWAPKHFTILHPSNEGSWDCLPKHNLVPSAPIVVPL